MSKANENILKVFGMTNQIITDDLGRVEREFEVELGHIQRTDHSETEYYPQFERHVRIEAAKSARYFEVFFCLEKTIRVLISEMMEDTEGENWWNSSRVNPHIKGEVTKRIRKEADAGVSRRSVDELDYTTFGELSVLITSNWDLFGGMFTSQKAVERVLGSLNSLRGPIAHCSELKEDEVVRLRLTVRDWFRLME